MRKLVYFPGSACNISGVSLEWVPSVGRAWVMAKGIGGLELRRRLEKVLVGQ